jgi:rubrerythrin
MTKCEFCPSEATWAIVMGSHDCEETMEYASCDMHMSIMKQAASILEDYCGHRVDEVLMQELGEDPATLVLHPDHPERTPREIAKILDSNSIKVECDQCGRCFPSLREAETHSRKHLEQKAEVVGGATALGGKTSLWTCPICGTNYRDQHGAVKCMSAHMKNLEKRNLNPIRPFTKKWATK